MMILMTKVWLAGTLYFDRCLLFVCQKWIYNFVWIYCDFLETEWLMRWMLELLCGTQRCCSRPSDLTLVCFSTHQLFQSLVFLLLGCSLRELAACQLRPFIDSEATIGRNKPPHAPLSFKTFAYLSYVSNYLDQFWRMLCKATFTCPFSC